MAPEEKYYETGGYPYYLNIDTTNRDFSENDLTAPEFNLLDAITTHYIIIEPPTEVKPLYTESIINTEINLQPPTQVQDI